MAVNVRFQTLPWPPAPHHCTARIRGDRACIKSHSALKHSPLRAYPHHGGEFRPERLFVDAIVADVTAFRGLRLSAPGRSLPPSLPSRRLLNGPVSR